MGAMPHKTHLSVERREAPAAAAAAAKPGDGETERGVFMTEYYVPTAESETELTEKRSRFIGRVWPVQDEDEARRHIEEAKKKHYDARHNCWCYRLRSGVERYSDDGEPQGTAGQPMLNVFQREAVVNICCVVTRYFGGVLLGAGGLVRAYTQSAKEALDAAGISVVRRWVDVAVPCPYALFERVKLEAESLGGVLGEPEYAAEVTMPVLLPEEKVKSFTQRITEITAGGVVPVVTGERLKDVPR